MQTLNRASKTRCRFNCAAVECTAPFTGLSHVPVIHSDVSVNWSSRSSVTKCEWLKQWCENGLQAKPQKFRNTSWKKTCASPHTNLTEPQIESHNVCGPDIDSGKRQCYSEKNLVMSLSKPVITPSPLMSRLCLLCFLLSFFPSPSLVFQLSGGGRTRTKRQIVVDDDMNQPHIIEPQAARFGPHKESYLLVRS